ncbi:hypothetical protein EPUS_05378 [Endocarpon pusillum Z07020]|uniref:Uncharacterized protein n=1 Tax=Endocarpon pusillum (strain Z07020 / HMAS-L-300199) TaxID=1263415 RepID=U1HTM2_ENDPU|nr:uncharacterized protein EPUS_05378 [Endocarpon pusillum Z07020]ERF73955.1 hypothetical protein EPUS_05378 [Endocarpon pusillum Z07020]
MSEEFVRGCLGVQPRGYNGGPISTVAGPYLPSETIDITPLRQDHSKISIESVDKLIYEDLGQEYRVRGVIKAEIRVPKPGHPYAFIATERQPFHLAPPGSYGDALIGQARPPKPNENRFIYWTFQEIQELRKLSETALLNLLQEEQNHYQESMNRARQHGYPQPSSASYQAVLTVARERGLVP